MSAARQDQIATIIHQRDLAIKRVATAMAGGSETAAECLAALEAFGDFRLLEEAIDAFTAGGTLNEMIYHCGVGLALENGDITTVLDVGLVVAFSIGFETGKNFAEVAQLEGMSNGAAKQGQ